MKPQNMNISLEGIRLFAYHGVLEQERIVGAMYTINLVLTTDFLQASMTDNLEHTINYAEVYQCVREEMKKPSQLLENVIYRIAERLFVVFPTLTTIKIGLYKENPPMEADCRQVGVEATYTR